MITWYSASHCFRHPRDETFSVVIHACRVFRRGQMHSCRAHVAFSVTRFKHSNRQCLNRHRVDFEFQTDPVLSRLFWKTKPERVARQASHTSSLVGTQLCCFQFYVSRFNRHAANMAPPIQTTKAPTRAQSTTTQEHTILTAHSTQEHSSHLCLHGELKGVLRKSTTLYTVTEGKAFDTPN